MIRALVIDDEESSVNVMKLLLQKHVPEVTDVKTAIGSASGLQAIAQWKPQLLFLDIEMPLLNGFELLEHFPDHAFEVIFVTAYDHYAIKAIKYSALDYLLKPIDTDELKQAVARYLEKQSSGKDRQARYHNLVHNLKSETVTNYRLALATTEGTFFLRPEEIIRCEADGNYTRFYLKDRKAMMVSRTLREYDELLSEQGFIRVHRAHLVNSRYVISFSPEYELKMADETRIEVSRRRREEVKRALIHLN